jgi:hypothetical protein
MAGSSSRYRKHPPHGDRAAICDTCGVRYLRSQLVRGADGFLRCSGAGTLNDARGLTAVELDELQAQAAEQLSNSIDYFQDGARIDDTEAEMAGGGGEIG